MTPFTPQKRNPSILYPPLCDPLQKEPPQFFTLLFATLYKRSPSIFYSPLCDH
jgi:hypothetical protein